MKNNVVINIWEMRKRMEIEVLVTIGTMIMIVIVKLIKKYMIENNIKKDLIYSIEDKKDKFIDTKNKLNTQLIELQS